MLTTLSRLSGVTESLIFSERMHKLQPMSLRRDLLPIFALAMTCIVSGNLGAQAGKASGKATTGKSVIRPAPTPKRIAPVISTTSARGAAWSLPDANLLVERVYARIVAQDKPGAVPIAQYQRRFFGHDTTVFAVRQFMGRDIDVSPDAFSAVSGWTDSPKLNLPLCEGPGCPAPINSLWLAITKIERGELSHEVNVWYTTTFAAESPGGPAQASYAFCERWLRLGGSWKYDGFIRVAGNSDYR